MLRIFSFLSILLYCTSTEHTRNTVVVFAFSGLRWDLPNIYRMPAFERLKKQGVYVRQKTNTFQSESLPSFVTMDTGVWPDRHGMLANRMKDRTSGELFTSQVKSGGWWKDVHPVWMDNQKRGQYSALCYWPGNQVVFDQSQKAHYNCKQSGMFDPFVEFTVRGSVAGTRMSYDARVNRTKEWLTMKDKRPTFIGVYFEDPYLTVMRQGLKSNHTRQAMKHIDRCIDRMMRFVSSSEAPQNVHFIVTGESGFSELSSNHYIFIDDGDKLLDVIDNGPITLVDVYDDHTRHVLASRWAQRGQMSVYNGSRLPEELHFSYVNRTMPIILAAKPQWRIYPKRVVNNYKALMGYDGREEISHSLLVAQGALLKPGARLKRMENIYVYNIVCRILNIVPRKQYSSSDVGNRRVMDRFFRHVTTDWVGDISKKITSSTTLVTLFVILLLLVVFAAIYLMVSLVFRASDNCCRKTKVVVSQHQHLLASEDDEEEEVDTPQHDDEEEFLEYTPPNMHLYTNNINDTSFQS